MHERGGVPVDVKVAVRLDAGVPVFAAEFSSGIWSPLDLRDPGFDLRGELDDDLFGGLAAHSGEGAAEGEQVVLVRLVGGGRGVPGLVVDPGRGADQEPFRVGERGDDPLVGGDQPGWGRGRGRGQDRGRALAGVQPGLEGPFGGKALPGIRLVGLRSWPLPKSMCCRSA